MDIVTGGNDREVGQEAVVRLYELARNGEVDNLEFSQLDSLVYGRFQEAYADDAPALHAVRI